MSNATNRSRRLRRSPAIRALIRETRISGDNLVQPFFVMDGKAKRQSIPSMPGVERYSVDLLLKEIERFHKLGGRVGLIFGLPARKDTAASGAYADNGIVQRAVSAIKKNFPNFLVITDVCLCAYTSHGHCGVLRDGKIDNDLSLPLLAQTAVSHAAAGADIVAPSDMMDFRVRAIRAALDGASHCDTPILSYAVKYASAYYGPFRDAADCAPAPGAAGGDRKTYQMDPANIREALKEARQDIKEGADFVMVKPALAYLDIISALRKNLDVPVAAYNVSGEYSMVKAAAAKGWIDERSVVLENLTAFSRAGADIIITYHAKDALTWLKNAR